MGMLRFDHVGLVFEDLDAAIDFFVSLGFEPEGRTTVDGEVVDKINGLDGVRAELMMVRTPDRSGRLELIKYHSPPNGDGPEALPSNALGLRHICIEVDDLNGIVERARAGGFEPVGEVQDYGNIYRLVYLRGPEGMILELAEKLG
jgi:catechol 2,3-dioxygenase-like lactoylglutathione lyase family enzyme